MDQKLTQLDPKLKEAYERVMGLNIPQPALTTTKPTQTPPPKTSSPINQASTPQSNKLNDIPRESKITSSFIASSKPAVSNPAPEVKKERGKISPVFIIAGVIIFFVSYTVIWVKIFKLSIPFLPNF